MGSYPSGKNTGCAIPGSDTRAMMAAEASQCQPPATPSRQLLVSLRNKLGDIRSMSGELLTRVSGPVPTKDPSNQCATPVTPAAIIFDLEILDREASCIVEQLSGLLNLI